MDTKASETGTGTYLVNPIPIHVEITSTGSPRLHGVPGWLEGLKVHRPSDRVKPVSVPVGTEDSGYLKCKRERKLFGVETWESAVLMICVNGIQPFTYSTSSRSSPD